MGGAYDKVNAGGPRAKSSGPRPPHGPIWHSLEYRGFRRVGAAPPIGADRGTRGRPGRRRPRTAAASRSVRRGAGTGSRSRGSHAPRRFAAAGPEAWCDRPGFAIRRDPDPFPVVERGQSGSAPIRPRDSTRPIWPVDSARDVSEAATESGSTRGGVPSGGRAGCIRPPLLATPSRARVWPVVDPCPAPAPPPARRGRARGRFRACPRRRARHRRPAGRGSPPYRDTRSWRSWVEGAWAWFTGPTRSSSTGSSPSR